MKVVVTAPVADRPWALPDWYRRLSEQTQPPAEIILLHSGQKGDDTWRAIDESASNYGIRTHRMHDSSTPHRRHDNKRYATLASLRNQLLALASILTDCDVLFSLDTDVMLEDPESIERLVPVAKAFGVSSPLLYLHPDMPWTVNAGMLESPELFESEETMPPREALEKWAWCRAKPTPGALAGETVQPIDIPMAAIVMSRAVFSTARYAWHESGEDIAFGIALKRLHHRAMWVPSIEARHVWDETRL